MYSVFIQTNYIRFLNIYFRKRKNNFVSPVYSIFIQNKHIGFQNTLFSIKHHYFVSSVYSVFIQTNYIGFQTHCVNDVGAVTFNIGNIPPGWIT